ncbi:LOW QUALITY PROTEIN: hypothetical protein PHMEG_0009708 [Phytophthora megakarya]|uniref:ubiquitinyl hydrolase 1 n=1 Tax=Phytophthora megakarya TaxID=4795 RepID=A0A225WFU8_9STRA|nr:LOW QUALITY PROTEIN: hypothetical protein PHMEG_0009708 [Phytophthora megakarya]
MVTVSDVLSTIKHFMFWYHSAKAREQFRKYVLQFMELCVLEDKMNRVVRLTKRKSGLADEQLVSELTNVRDQFVVAQHLIDEPGTVCQLAMGRGKTRVILPMLFLHFTRSRNPRVVRAHFLSHLLSEAQQYMHKYLSASNALCILDEILDDSQFLDVLDKCDAILHHKYHLVYAVGEPTDLNSGIERWKSIEVAASFACFLQFSRFYAKRLGAFEGTRLNTVLLREELKSVGAGSHRQCPIRAIVAQHFGTTPVCELLVQGLTDSSVSVQTAFGHHVQKFLPFPKQLLALRGLVAFGVLEYCLEKRYQVDFGLPLPARDRRKSRFCSGLPMFHRIDLNSAIQTFASCLLYLDITMEVSLTRKLLLRLDISEQHQQYDQWYESVKSSLSEENRKTLCDVRHISLTDTRQFELLCRFYKFCMGAINFYLNTCVFPKDTQQYPQQLSRTAWNLAGTNNSIGFSGTNDIHRLLPLSVKQREHDELSLLGTNSTMIDKIVRVTQGYKVVLQSSIRTAIPWQNVLLFAISKDTQVLIATGALLAGVMNHDAAEFLLSQPNFRFAGVTYFHSRKDHDCWMIAEKVRRLVKSLRNASMLEKEMFVIFDEAQSRGSGMKLPHDALLC